MKPIYLDNAATTALDPRVLREMEFVQKNIYANPGSLHQPGQQAKEILVQARMKVAQLINTGSQEIVFISGGTESINMAIKGVALQKGKGHIITSKIEHPAVLETCRYLETKGFSVTYLDVDKEGIINPKEVESAIKKDTILVSIMYANNEIGTIEPINQISKITKKHKILFHTDACQAGGALELDVQKLGVDLMTLNGSKIHGPKGVGILYVKKGTKLEPLFHGGNQEFGLRSGTENLVSIVGFTKALDLVEAEKEKNNAKLIKLRDYLIKQVTKTVPRTFLNGPKTKRLPNNVSISFLDVEGESILLYLNEAGIYVSTGSACSSNKLEISPVLDAIGLKHDSAHGTIRFTLGLNTTKKELDYVVKELKKIIGSLRLLSPIHLGKEDIRK